LQTAGDLDIIPPAIYAAWQDDAASSVLAIGLLPALVSSVREVMNVFDEEVEPQFHVRDARIEHIGWALKAELEAEYPLGRLYAESLAVALCTQLLRRYGSSKSLNAVESLPKRRIQRAIQYIRE